jgi:hypothetical protein
MAHDRNFPLYQPGRVEAMRETRRLVVAGIPQQQIRSNYAYRSKKMMVPV